MQLGSWKEMGGIIKGSVMTDYFPGYEMGKGNHQQQWRPLSNRGLKGRKRAGEQT